VSGATVYAYANENPVSNSDPTGEFIPLIVILPVIGGVIGGISDVLTAGPCQSKWGAFGRGFASGALGTLSGIGVTVATGNLWLAGAAAGAVAQGVDQGISGEGNIRNAVVGTALGGIGGGVAARLLPTAGRLPSLIIPRTLSNTGPNSLRMMGQEAGSDAVGGIGQAATSSPECGCQ
jgi:hypothetical protein